MLAQYFPALTCMKTEMNSISPPFFLFFTHNLKCCYNHHDLQFSWKSCAFPTSTDFYPSETGPPSTFWGIRAYFCKALMTKQQMRPPQAVQIVLSFQRFHRKILFSACRLLLSLCSTNLTFFHIVLTPSKSWPFSVTTSDFTLSFLYVL